MTNISMPFYMILIFLFAISNVQCQDLTRNLDSLISGYPSNTLDIVKNPEYIPFNGAVLISKGGEIVLKKAYGKANLEWNIDNTLETKFLVGSVSKTFTSMLTMLLVQEGKLKLDDKLVDYIPFSLEGSQAVTIHHLLSHTSGLPQYGDLMDSKEVRNNLWRRTYDSDELISVLIKYVDQSKMGTKTGSEFQYNSLNYVFLGLVLEKASGSLFAELLEEKICRPLSLLNTGYALNSEVLKQFSTSYRSQRDTISGKIIFTHADYRDRTFEYASGGIYSTVEDLYDFVKAVNENELLSEKYTSVLLNANLDSYGYGWWIKDPRYLIYGPEIEMVSHAGGVEAFRANVAIVDEGDIMITILSNVAPLATRKLTYDLIQLTKSGLLPNKK